MRLRRSTLADCPELARLHRATIRSINAKDYPAEIIEEWSANTSAAKFRNSFDHVIRYVVEENNHIIGFGDILKKDGNLGGIYVHKDWIGKGVGGMLMKQLIADAKKLGATEWIFDASTTAKSFYEAKGCTVVSLGKIQHRLSSGRLMDAYTMRKVL